MPNGTIDENTKQYAIELAKSIRQQPEISANINKLLKGAKLPPHLDKLFQTLPWIIPDGPYKGLIDHGVKNKAYLYAYNVGESQAKPAQEPQFEHYKINENPEFEFRFRKRDFFKKGRKPTSDFLLKPFNVAGESKVTAVPHYYTYQPNDGKTHFYLVFGNKNLGGGTMESYALVMEEILDLESTTYGEEAAKDPRISVRTDANLGLEGQKIDGVGGSPQPYIIKNAAINQKINNLYGTSGCKILQDENLSLDDLKKTYVERRVPPITVNLVTAAFPKVPFGSDEKANHNNQWDATTLTNCLNDLCAVIESMKKNTPQPPPLVLDSGKIGCGVFNNNPDAVYLLHKAAAQQCGVEIVLHDYGPHRGDDLGNLEKVWQEIEQQFPGEKKLTSARVAELISEKKDQFKPRPPPALKRQ